MRCWLSPAPSWSSLTSAPRPGKACAAGFHQEPACRDAAVRCRGAARLHATWHGHACTLSIIDHCLLVHVHDLRGKVGERRHCRRLRSLQGGLQR